VLCKNITKIEDTGAPLAWTSCLYMLIAPLLEVVLMPNGVLYFHLFD